MKTLRFSLALSLALSIAPFSVLTLVAKAQDPQAQNQISPVVRGYRTGYSDGYQSGISDAASGAPREFHNKAEYDRADRAYNPNWGSLEEYRNGYQQGFEIGYDAGYSHKPFDSSIPPDLKPRDNATAQNQGNQNPVDQNQTSNSQPNNSQTNNSQPTDNQASAPLTGDVIRRDTIMRVELLTSLSTNTSQKGDQFQARIVDPKEYDGAILQGHVAQVKRPGKAKGNAELQLAFDQIKLVDGHTSKLNAQVIEVIPTGGSHGVGKVDSEGGVQGQDSTRGDVTKVGGAAGIGAIIGLITGGGTGAAIGAGIGAGVGTAGVLTQRGKDIHLNEGQQLRIRTNTDAELQ